MLLPLNMFKPSFIFLLTVLCSVSIVDLFMFHVCLLICCLVCLQPYGRPLGKGLPLGSLACDDFVTFPYCVPGQVWYWI